MDCCCLDQFETNITWSLWDSCWLEAPLLFRIIALGLFLFLGKLQEMGKKKKIHTFFFPSHVVPSTGCAWLFAAPWTGARQASVSFTVSWSLLKLMSIEWVMLSNHLILCHPLLLLPSIFPSIRVFSNESALHIRWPKYWSFSFSLSPSNEYSGLISFRIDWFDLSISTIFLDSIYMLVYNIYITPLTDFILYKRLEVHLPH